MTELPTDTQLISGHEFDTCEWCGVEMGEKETSTSATVISGITYHLCFFCRTFTSKTAMAAYKATIIKDATNPELSEYYGYPWI